MKRDWGGVALPPSPRIATKAELDRLRQSRPVPAPERHLSPDGPEASQVNQKVMDANETRMVDLQDRLQTMRETADRDFAFAQNEGRAKADFERSR
tara:strand:+ start:16267 stop:16554 length:288 start_codon:yes stop_codon:yes gene_type:complete